MFHWYTTKLYLDDRSDRIAIISKLGFKSAVLTCDASTRRLCASGYDHAHKHKHYEPFSYAYAYVAVVFSEDMVGISIVLADRLRVFRFTLTAMPTCSL